jgi:fatty acid desaturase
MRNPWSSLGLALAVFPMAMAPAFAQLAAEETVQHDALHRFVDDNMLVAFGIVALIGFIAGVALTHLRNK